MSALDWLDDAACAGLPTGMFFPLPGDRRTPERAKRVCLRCPVKRECADYGRDERFGIWGGATARERNKHFRDTGDWVDATGSTRRLRALAVLGYGAGHLAREVQLCSVPLTRQGFEWIRSRGAVRTDNERAAAIVDLYVRLVRRGPNDQPRSDIARNLAAREGWHGPEAWAGVNIDDPKAVPRKRSARLAA